MTNFCNLAQKTGWRPGWRLILPLLALLLIWLGPAVHAQDDSTVTTNGLAMTIRGGFDGFYKQGQWVPITIELSNDGPALDAVVRIAIGRETDGQVIYDTPVALPTQSQKRLTTFVYFPSFTTSLTAQLIAAGDEVTSVRLTNVSQMGPEELLFGILSDEPGELEFLENVTGGRQNAQVAFLELADLPDAAAGWNALDILILNDVDTGRLSAEQRTALDAWINTGGQLVVTGGSNWQQNSAGVADLLPVQLQGTASFDDLPELRQRFGFEYRDDGPYVVTTSSLREGEVLYAEGSTPLLVKRQIGRGFVFFLALDPKTAPLRDWDGNELLWAEVARAAAELPFWATGVKEASIVRDAVRNLSALALPSAWLLLCFLSLYVLAIGPVNYFVLKRMGRRELAWLTIPALILLFSLGSILTGFRTKGNEVIINQLSVAYGQINGEQAQVETSVGLYSPRRDVFDISFPADALVRPLHDTFGIVGGGNIGTISRDSDVTVSNVRVDVSATETFVVNTVQPLPKIDGKVTMRVDSSGVLLEIAVSNDSDVTIDNAVVVFGYELIAIGDLAPGQSEVVTAVLNQRASLPSGGTGSSSPYGINSPLIATRNEVAVFGENSNFGRFDDPVLQSRYQLLQALHGNIYSSEMTEMPQGIVTLMGWTDVPQVEMALNARNTELIATTLYFLEMPLTHTLAAAENIEISQGLWTIDIRDYNGLYNPYPFDLDLANGWVEYEFTPWADFQSIDVEGLDVLLTLPTGGYYDHQTVPDVSLWDWGTEQWVDVSNITWGQTRIAEFEPFVNETGSVRLRLNHNTFDSIRIREVQPILYGDL